jgi:hypothetical protein
VRVAESTQRLDFTIQSLKARQVRRIIGKGRRVRQAGRFFPATTGEVDHDGGSEPQGHSGSLPRCEFLPAWLFLDARH